MAEKKLHLLIRYFTFLLDKIKGRTRLVFARLSIAQSLMK